MHSNGFQSRSLRKKRGSVRPQKRLHNASQGVVRFGFSLWDRRPRTRSAWKWFIVKGGVTVFSIGILYFAFLWLTLPDIHDPTSLLASQSTVITDRNGTELYRLFSEEDRTFIPGDQIPLYAKQAMIAIEDERFYERGCVDVRALARVVFANITDFWSQGGSTITQQLTRNALGLTREKRVSRKIKEWLLACQLEREYTKDELIDLYANWIPFGRNAYGIEQASKLYFGVSAQDLTLAQAAILAALPQLPSYYNPYGSHLHTSVNEDVEQKIITGAITQSSQISDDDVAIGLLGATVGTGSTTLYVGGRTDQVLRNMQNQGYITQEQYEDTVENLKEMTFQPLRENIRAPHFVLWVRDFVEQMFEGTSEEGLLEQGGLTIETTLDWELQQAAEDMIAKHREDIQEIYGAENMALVTVDPHTREVLAYVGNMDYDDREHGGKIDMVLAPRQPGSSFKPFVYAAAFQKGYSPATPIYDVPTKIGDDEPQNFDGSFMGLMTMRQALGASRNIPAAKTYFLAGQEDAILNLVHDLGAASPSQRKDQLQEERGEFDYGWPLALGAAETPLFEMVQAYTTFASGGEYYEPVRIRRITDKKGNIIYEPEKPKKDTVLDPRVAYQITSVLSDESARPDEYWKTQLTVSGYQTAAKTGTSNKCLEWEEDDEGQRYCLLRKPDNAWLIGYTPYLVTGVWVGNADSASMYDRAGGLNTASPIWKDYMTRAHRIIETDDSTFPVPQGIVQPQVSLLSGQLPTECTPVHLRRADVFLDEYPPSQADPACATLNVDRLTHLIASESCPAEAREEGQFLVAHSLLPQRWPTWEEGVQEWVTEQMEKWYADETHSGAIIPLPVAPTEECNVDLTPGRLVRPTLRVLTPSHGGVVTYPAFRPRISHSVGSSVREVAYFIDGKSVAVQTDKPFDRTIRVPRSIAKGGSHMLRVELTDEYYNKIGENVSFRFGADTGAPTVRLVNPDSDRRIEPGETLEIRADAEDSGGEIKYVQFFLGNTLLTTKPKAPFTFSYTMGLPNGSYVLRAVAEDLGSNRSEDSVTLYLGIDPSTAESSAPSPDTEVNDVAPVLLEPLASLESIAKNQVIDVRMTTPPLDGYDLSVLRLVVRNEASGHDDVLLELREGEGQYVRPWSVDFPGTYSIRLITEDRDRKETEWEMRMITVE